MSAAEIDRVSDTFSLEERRLSLDLLLGSALELPSYRIWVLSIDSSTLCHPFGHLLLLVDLEVLVIKPNR